MACSVGSVHFDKGQAGASFDVADQPPARELIQPTGEWSFQAAGDASHVLARLHGFGETEGIRWARTFGQRADLPAKDEPYVYQTLLAHLHENLASPVWGVMTYARLEQAPSQIVPDWLQIDHFPTQTNLTGSLYHSTRTPFFMRDGARFDYAADGTLTVEGASRLTDFPFLLQMRQVPQKSGSPQWHVTAEGSSSELNPILMKLLGKGLDLFTELNPHRVPTHGDHHVFLKRGTVSAQIRFAVEYDHDHVSEIGSVRDVAVLVDGQYRAFGLAMVQDHEGKKRYVELAHDENLIDTTVYAPDQTSSHPYVKLDVHQSRDFSTRSRPVLDLLGLHIHGETLALKFHDGLAQKQYVRSLDLLSGRVETHALNGHGSAEESTLAHRMMAKLSPFHQRALAPSSGRSSPRHVVGRVSPREVSLTSPRRPSPWWRGVP